jgi:pyruvate dehydrogenase E2 component (dihydrolipoamide acetyltransferase)
MSPSKPRSADDGAPFEYLLPSLGADMDVGRIVEWRVNVGDAVHRGDVMAVVETEKSDIDIEIWHDGVVDEFLVPLGKEIDVGTPIARMQHLDGDKTAEPTITAERAPAHQTGPKPKTSPILPVAPQAGLRVPASPLARRLAAERGLDLAGVRGSGPSGAIVEADILSIATTGGDATPTTEQRRMPGTMRSVIAERMARSNREIPHYHLARDVDLAALDSWLITRNADRPIAERVLPAALYIRAVALAAARHPELNGYWIDNEFEAGTAVNVAMAISLRKGGLVTPHVGAADECSVDDIMSTLTEMVAAARTGTLRSSWMTGATITITNLGDTGADLVHGVISPPQVALVGFGRVSERPWVVDDVLVIRPVVTITLAADHRATDGAVGSRFLTTLATLLGDPEKL